MKQEICTCGHARNQHSPYRKSGYGMCFIEKCDCEFYTQVKKPQQEEKEGPFIPILTSSVAQQLYEICHPYSWDIGDEIRIFKLIQQVKDLEEANKYLQIEYKNLSKSQKASKLKNKYTSNIKYCFEDEHDKLKYIIIKLEAENKELRGEG